jgi:hypothetical protein
MTQALYAHMNNKRKKRYETKPAGIRVKKIIFFLKIKTHSGNHFTGLLQMSCKL